MKMSEGYNSGGKATGPKNYKTNKMAYGSSEDSEQSVHPPNQIRVDEKAMIRDRYNRIPHPALDTKWERYTYNSDGIK